MIATYSQLQAAILDWSTSDTDTFVQARVADFIMLFETVANRRLRIRAQEATVTLTPISGAATLPVDYLSWRRVAWTGSAPHDLEYVNPTYLRTLFLPGITGVPSVFTIQGPTLNVGPSDDSNLTFHYFQKIPALSDSNTANWLLTAYPDAYLFGGLTELYAYRKDTENMTLWGQRRDAIFDEIERLDVKTRGPASVRVVGPTP